MINLYPCLETYRKDYSDLIKKIIQNDKDLLKKDTFFDVGFCTKYISDKDINQEKETNIFFEFVEKNKKYITIDEVSYEDLLRKSKEKSLFVIETFIFFKLFDLFKKDIISYEEFKREALKVIDCNDVINEVLRELNYSTYISTLKEEEKAVTSFQKELVNDLVNYKNMHNYNIFIKNLNLKDNIKMKYFFDIEGYFKAVTKIYADREK